MPWLRVGDTSATHPIVLRALELDDADDRILNELFGFVSRCAVLAAAHKTDYIVETGIAKQVAGMSRWQALTEAAVFSGYFTRVEGEDGRLAFKLVSDDELFHMRLKDEIEWERTQRNDTRNKSLIVPVRHRDGDGCRWCGRLVRWGDQKSGIGGTYDHVKPGVGAETPDDLVVACRQCNLSRRNDVESWQGRQLLNVSKDPYYSKKSIAFLAENGITVTNQKTLDMEFEGRAESFKPVVETPSPVESNSVDRDTVEPETPAPGPADPECTAPGEVETPAADSSDDWNPTLDELDDYIEVSGEYPAWHPMHTANAETVESNPVEPETLAPGRTAPTTAPATEKPDSLNHSELFPTSTPSDLDLPGRDGTGKEKNSIQENSPEPKDHGTTGTKPRRRRRRRSKGQKND